ncbi:MAG: glycosyltransferase [Chthoniobacterales bacterium]|nr:glycosyltransferase [Chthoniobacterales bacterium]
MWVPYYGSRVVAWPVGIDIDRWSPAGEAANYDFLIYDKVRWHHHRFEEELIDPIRSTLKERSLSFTEIRYGSYHEEEYERLLHRCRAMIFLCEHETQGIAYQQALSSGIPILAWDRAGYWEDPSFFPEKVQFAPVSSVPYWDHRCGEKFADAADVRSKLERFLDAMASGQYAPRDYILENLTLEHCARRYVEIVKEVEAEL